jgi:hydroxypyruvate isomerase
MPDFAANLSTMFTELPFLQRFNAAARCGFSGVEFAYPEAVAEKELARRLRECDLTLVAFNLPAGKSEQGERGIACDPGRIQEFREGIGTEGSQTRRWSKGDSNLYGAFPVK